MSDLPYSAVLFNADEVTERMSRRIAKARNRILPVIVTLSEKGYMDPIPAIGSVDKDGVWDDARIERQALVNLKINAEMTDDQITATDDYQVELILTMVKSWEKASLDIDAVLDLPTAKFQTLANACDAVLRGTVVDLEPSPDPLVTAADSQG